MDDKEIILQSYKLKYTILRRAIQNRGKEYGFCNYSKEGLEKLSYELEGKDLKELEEIYKKWILNA